MLAMFYLCTFKLSNSFLPNCQFLFCQATHFCSARLNIFVRGRQGPPPRNTYVYCLVGLFMILSRLLLLLTIILEIRQGENRRSQNILGPEIEPSVIYY